MENRFTPQEHKMLRNSIVFSAIIIVINAVCIMFIIWFCIDLFLTEYPPLPIGVERTWLDRNFPLILGIVGSSIIALWGWKDIATFPQKLNTYKIAEVIEELKPEKYASIPHGIPLVLQDTLDGLIELNIIPSDENWEPLLESVESEYTNGVDFFDITQSLLEYTQGHRVVNGKYKKLPAIPCAGLAEIHLEDSITEADYKTALMTMAAISSGALQPYDVNISCSQNDCTFAFTNKDTHYNWHVENQQKWMNTGVLDRLAQIIYNESKIIILSFFMDSQIALYAVDKQHLEAFLNLTGSKQNELEVLKSDTLEGTITHR